ncbi:MAG: response regulator transcription factor [Dehalococcoidia bacterium]
MHILVADDEPNIRELVRLYLSKEGYDVEFASNGPEALDKALRLKPDLVVLDLMMPKLDGFEVTKAIREQSDVPILMLTVRKEDTVKVAGLELGADDYLTKPFNPKELVARVKAILRRADGIRRSGVQVSVGALALDRQRREAVLGGQPLTLRTKEFDLLFTLAQNAGIAMSREQLLSLVWGYAYSGETRTVDVHINHLRQHLQGSEIRIETLRGVGYKLTADSNGDG